VVARGIHDRDVVVGESCCLLEEETLGREGEPIAVEEVPGDEERVHLLTNREVHRPTEGLPGRLAEAPPHGLGTTGEGRVEMDVGHVQEAHEPN
jgi:hypothetical protein